MYPNPCPSTDTEPAAGSPLFPGRPLHRVTPLLDAQLGRHRAALKLENLQPARSFKIRGIGHMCRHHQLNGARSLVCSSAGNAGYAVAWAGRELGLPVTVILPAASSRRMRRRIADLGAQVKVHGKIWDDANHHALELAKQPGCAYIPPFDHPLLWQGHSTLVDELATQCRQPPDTIVLSLGGGGLLLGVLKGLERHGWGSTRVLAVEPEGAASLGRSLAENRIVALSRPSTCATSLCVSRISPSLLDACRQHRVEPVTVAESACIKACVRLANELGLVVEPACGTALAPLYDNHPAVEGSHNIVVIACGGQVVELEELAAWDSAIPVNKLPAHENQPGIENKGCVAAVHQP